MAATVPTDRTFGMLNRMSCDVLFTNTLLKHTISKFRLSYYPLTQFSINIHGKQTCLNIVSKCLTVRLFRDGQLDFCETLRKTNSQGNLRFDSEHIATKTIPVPICSKFYVDLENIKLPQIPALNHTNFWEVSRKV